MSNMELWDKLKSPPEEVKKTIIGGRLKGMTDIKPQWRFLVVTETFGPVGVGWKYTIDKLWTERTDDHHVCAFALVSFSYVDEGEWSEPIPGIGGSMLLTQEKSGAYTSDEAYKMAVTDALSVAMKSLGVGADVYMGYSDSKNQTNASGSAKAYPETGKTATDAQCKMLAAKMKANKVPTEIVLKKFGITRLGEILMSNVDTVVKYITEDYKIELTKSVMTDEPF